MGLFNKKRNDEPRLAVADTPSLFMHDDSEGDYGKEAMLDYQMSWVMRVAANKAMQEKNSLLHKRCTDILLKLIGKNGCNNIEVISVDVWKQWQHIDVHANVIVKCNGEEKKHLVVLEDKAYTMIHSDQLNRYEKTINEVYGKDKYLKGFEKHFWVITLFDKKHACYRELASYCNEANAKWKVISLEQLIENNSTETGSDLFDEFWIKPWSN